jgi:hypothetical protein
MKFFLLLTAMLAAALLTAAAGPGVTYIGHDKVAGALAKGGALVTASDLLVSGSHRDGVGMVEVHDKETDVMYVTDGSATLVTGGAMVGGKVTAPGQWRGTEIKGGDTHQLTKGGTPHWFKEVPKSVSYFVVKVLKP